MNGTEIINFGPAQRVKLDQIICDIKEFGISVSIDDPEAAYCFGLSVRDFIIELRILASPILPNKVVTRLNALEFDVDDFTASSKAKAVLDAIVPTVEDSLASFNRSFVPLPNADLPDDIKRDYEEAATILDHSPRSAAALLRLSIQKLCVHLGETGRNLNNDIAVLVEKGLRINVQKSLDTVRVIGNNAVHPGKLDLRDDIPTARALFDLVNMIADAMLTQPRQIEEIYQTLPESSRKAIDRRDKKKGQL